MRQTDWLSYFGYHEPTDTQRPACIRMRSAIGKVMETYLRETKAGAEQTANLRALKAVQMAMLSHIVAELPADAFQ